MKIEYTETLWLGEQHEFSLQELCDLSGCSELEIRELMEYGVLVPANPGRSAMTFSGYSLVTARTAHRLSKDLDLDQHGVALMIKLLERIQELEAQVRALHARLS